MASTSTTTKTNKRPRPDSLSPPTDKLTRSTSSISGSGSPTPKASRIVSLASLQNPDRDHTDANPYSNPHTNPSSNTHPNSSTETDTDKPSTDSVTCTLPPTCTHRPTHLANTQDLERHYAKYHAHVCEERGCGCVFPDARLLELHQTECHDPLSAIRKERGEKIFACHIPPPTCTKLFLTPKARRLHLINAHAYPKEYFFAITNKGIGGLLKRWGEGASLVRGAWKRRDGDLSNGGGEGGEERGGKGKDGDGERRIVDDTEDDDDEGSIVESIPASGGEDVQVEVESGGLGWDGSIMQQIGLPERVRLAQQQSDAEMDMDMDKLTSSMSSLSFVPSSIRFGRGAHAGGFGHTQSHSHSRKESQSQSQSRRGKSRNGNGNGTRSGVQPEVEGMDMDIDVASREASSVEEDEPEPEPGQTVSNANTKYNTKRGGRGLRGIINVSAGAGVGRGLQSNAHRGHHPHQNPMRGGRARAIARGRGLARGSSRGSGMSMVR